ncbi:MAG: hypothetical protein KDI46_01690 [Alphaproteobacteria bacterium]|nr:hypothetical protein [Alphaproteobacteria bacterium]
MKVYEKNEQKCAELKNQLNDKIREISIYEDQISQIKQSKNTLDNQIRYLETNVKNMMTSYGVSIDFIADAFIPNSYLAIAKGGYDLSQAPKASEIENAMNRIKVMKKEVKNKENEIMNIGMQIRSLTIEKEDLIQKWRFSGCQKNGF